MRNKKRCICICHDEEIAIRNCYCFRVPIHTIAKDRTLRVSVAYQPLYGKILELRVADQELTQAAIARALGTSRSYVQKVLSELYS